MTIEESHPLALVPDLFDRLTPRERGRALALWEVRYQDANRLVHPNTRRRLPETIARRVILEAVAQSYLPWLWLSITVSLVTAGAAIAVPWMVLATLGVSTVALVIGRRWLRARRVVTGYFAEHFPPGGRGLPARRAGD